MTPDPCIPRGINLESFYDHLGKGKHMLVLKPYSNIAYVEVVVIAAYAFRNAAYV